MTVNRAFAVAFLCLSWAADAQTSSPPPAALPSFRLNTGVELPVEYDRPVFSGLGFHSSLDASVPLWGGAPLLLGGGGTYSVLPLRAKNSITAVTLGMGPEVLLEPLPTLQVRLGAQGGGWAGFFNTPTFDPVTKSKDAVQSGFGAAVSAGADSELFLNPWLSLGLKAKWIQYLGMGQGVQFGLSARFNLEGLDSKVRFQSQPLQPVVPVLAKAYEANGLGAVTITNAERFEVQDLSVDFRIPGIVADYTSCLSKGNLRPGQRVEVPLKLILGQTGFALDKDSQQTAEVRIRYQLNGQPTTVLKNLSVQVFNRNAMTWDDDRKVAAFIDSKDSDVLTFAKAVSHLVHTSELAAMNENLRVAMAMYEALGEYRLAYARDPNTPGYVESSQNTAMVDYLQYPGQTLRFRGGDCDDLTILYASLMEAIGVRTAFITVPGHIYPAVAIDVPAASLAKLFPQADRFIVKDGTVWLPIEITLVGKRFSEAWETGALEWNEAVAKGQANLYVVSDSWRTWGSQGSPDYASSAAALDLEGLGQRYTLALQRQVSVLIADLTTPLLDPKVSKPDDPKVLNRLGIVYATYGLVGQAETAFKSASTGARYLPAMTNLASLKYSQGQYDEAADLYSRVLEKAPTNDLALSGLARSSRELRDQQKVEHYFSQLKTFDQALVALAPTTTASGGRASSIGAQGQTTWEFGD